jgi:hypothetical protein
MLNYQCAAALRDNSLRIILSDFELEPLPSTEASEGGRAAGDDA